MHPPRHNNLHGYENDLQNALLHHALPHDVTLIHTPNRAGRQMADQTTTASTEVVKGLHREKKID